MPRPRRSQISLENPFIIIAVVVWFAALSYVVMINIQVTTMTTDVVG